MTELAGKPTFESRAPSPTLAPSNISVDKETGRDEKVATATSGDDDDVAIEEEVEVAPIHTPADGEHHLNKVATHRSQNAGELAVTKTATREDGSEYPTGARLSLIMLALCLAVFLMALDNSIIATAIPKITDQFHSLGDVGWYGSAYLLTTAALQLLFGKFYTYFSIKWIFLGAIALFEVGSLICGVAQNSVTLIIGRAVAGLGSSGIFSGALIILAYSVTLDKRPMYSGLIASMYGIASVAGPLLGGVFTDKVTWRWCFLINLPIGVITLVVIGFFFTDPDRSNGQPVVHAAPKAIGDEKAAELSITDAAAADAASTKKKTLWEKIRPFDPIGSLVFMPAIICLLLALQWGGTTYAWKSGRIIALLVLFGVLISIFIVIQYVQQEDATVPPRIIKKRTVWSAGWYSFATGAAFLASVYFLPIWFQAVKGASAVSSGLMNLPMLISLVLTSIIAGGFVTVIGYYTPFMIIGSVLMPIGYGLISTFHPGITHGKWIGFQIIAGAGVGLGMQQPLMAVQTVLDIKDVPTGTSVIVFLQTLGGALFVSICENIFTNYLSTYVKEYVPGLDPKVVLATGATGIQSVIPADQIDGVILAYSDALAKTFVVSTALAAMTIIGAAFIEWKSVKGKKIEVGMA
ncbi:efflux pump antibiotic resistance [Ophiostoma piceae UAMH 11346]|uniref:Efflux pump antibiotic resistance n=1 Tax=Ophiostoma piceae (strain UAMH 11346) TaxID=1262450 RepID=S3C0A5_OPHP1|nr:efflux pump antibiotic resistance [Ophiostoma piceae UAMH 11346]